MRWISRESLDAEQNSDELWVFAAGDGNLTVEPGGIRVEVEHEGRLAAAIDATTHWLEEHLGEGLTIERSPTSWTVEPPFDVATTLEIAELLAWLIARAAAGTDPFEALGRLSMRGGVPRPEPLADADRIAALDHIGVFVVSGDGVHAWIARRLCDVQANPPGPSAYLAVRAPAGPDRNTLEQRLGVELGPHNLAAGGALDVLLDGEGPLFVYPIGDAGGDERERWRKRAARAVDNAAVLASAPAVLAQEDPEPEQDPGAPEDDSGNTDDGSGEAPTSRRGRFESIGAAAKPRAGSTGDTEVETSANPVAEPESVETSANSVAEREAVEPPSSASPRRGRFEQIGTAAPLVEEATDDAEPDTAAPGRFEAIGEADDDADDGDDDENGHDADPTAALKAKLAQAAEPMFELPDAGDPALYDLVLDYAGFDPERTAQLLTLLLDLDRPEADRLCSEAPVVIAEGIAARDVRRIDSIVRPASGARFDAKPAS